MTSHRTLPVASAGSWAVRGLAVCLGLLLPVVGLTPASAETAVVRDGQQDGGLRSMTVKRTPSGLEVVTYFAGASDVHTFGVKEPGHRRPTFRLTWRPDRSKLVRVTTARATPTRDKGEGVCRVDRASYDGPEARTMSFRLPASCLWIREGQEIPRYKVNQRALDEVDGAAALADELGYTRFLSRRR